MNLNNQLMLKTLCHQLHRLLALLFTSEREEKKNQWLTFYTSALTIYFHMRLYSIVPCLCQLQFTLSCCFMGLIHAAYGPDSSSAVENSPHSIRRPSGRRSHLVNAKGETCRYTLASLNPPSRSFLSLPLPPPRRPVVLGLYKQPSAQRQPLPCRRTKAAFTSTFWWPSEGNVVVAGRCPLDHRSPALHHRGYYVCLLWAETKGEECQVPLGQTCTSINGAHV